MEKEEEVPWGVEVGRPRTGSEESVTESFKAMAAEEVKEEILRENPDRFCMFPLRYPGVWELYKQAMACFWTCEEVDLAQDMAQWMSLEPQERHFIKHVLAFFASSDGIVVENLAVRFMGEVQVPEIRAFYGFQIAIENIHSEMYSLMLEAFVKDVGERSRLFRAMETVPCVRRKAEWALKWISGRERSGHDFRMECEEAEGSAAAAGGEGDDDAGSGSSFATRLVAFACVEGLFFSGSFCAIFWLKKRGIMPGLCFSNELISRDEGLHTNFACHLYRDLVEETLPDERVESMVRQAVEIEREFICDALPCDLLGMNRELMYQYIRYVADHLLVNLGHQKIFLDSNPFDWMELISLQGKTNFFERRVGEYQKAGVMASLGDGNGEGGQYVFTLDEDF